MLKRAAGRAMWLGGRISALFGLALGMALVLGVGTYALAAVPGDPFRLGQTNPINNAITSLAGKRDGGAMMLVDNNSAAAGSRALDLRSEPGRAPLTVNPEAGKAPNLSADRLDGKDSADFLPRDVYFVEDSSLGTGGGSFLSRSARCDQGDRILGGGGGFEIGSDSLAFSGAFVDGFNGQDSWFVQVKDNSPASVITAQAICADFPPLRNP